MKQKTVENIFFTTEVLFLLSTCAIALYNIYFDKNMIPLLVVLGGYILTIKALRRMFVNKEAFKEKKSKYVTFTYLTLSTYMVLHVSFVMFL